MEDHRSLDLPPEEHALCRHGMHKRVKEKDEGFSGSRNRVWFGPVCSSGAHRRGAAWNLRLHLLLLPSESAQPGMGLLGLASQHCLCSHCGYHPALRGL